MRASRSTGISESGVIGSPRLSGKRRFQTLGTDREGWNEERARRELDDTLALVRKEKWQPERREPDVPKEELTFHQFASDWLEQRRSEGVADKTIADLRWSLELHLLLLRGIQAVGDHCARGRPLQGREGPGAGGHRSEGRRASGGDRATARGATEGPEPRRQRHRAATHEADQ